MHFPSPHGQIGLLWIHSRVLISASPSANASTVDFLQFASVSSGIGSALSNGMRFLQGRSGDPCVGMPQN